MTHPQEKKTAFEKFTGKLGPPTVILLALAVLTIWTWRKWPDLLIDFGRELYIPWQLLAGKVLYQDLAYFNGPLSPYLNAFWFKLFGTSLTTLIFCNLALLLLLLYLLYHLLNRACGRLTATFSCLVFLCVFGLAQLSAVGNYNYVCPYSHELTHGIILTLLMIFFWDRYAQSGRTFPLIGAGFSYGLIFLGKAEIFTAASFAVAVGFFLRFASPGRQDRQGRLMTSLLIFIGAAMLPVTFFFLYFSTKMQVSPAFLGVLGSWPALLTSKVSDLPFYQHSIGLDHPWPNLVAMVKTVIVILVIISTFGVTDYLFKGKFNAGLLFVIGLVVIVPVNLIFLGPRPLLIQGNYLPLTTLTLIILIFFAMKQSRREMVRLSSLAMWAVFAFFMLAKIVLNCRIPHYGFALAMPATVLLVVGLMDLVPQFINRFWGGGQVFQVLILVLLCFDVAAYLLISKNYYDEKTFSVGSDGDRIVTYAPNVDPRGPAVKQLLDQIHHRLPPAATLSVLPEGVMVNYLARRPNPTPFVNFMPPELEIFGKAQILAAFKRMRPDFMVLIHKDTTEYGVGYFGRDPNYGKGLMDWIKRHYTEVWRAFQEPLTDGRFGIKMLKWNG